MHRMVIACRPTTPLAKVAKAMDEKKIASIVVIDNEGNFTGHRARMICCGHKAATATVRSATGMAMAPTAVETVTAMIGGQSNRVNLCGSDVVTGVAGRVDPRLMQRLIDHHVDSLIVVERENGHAKPVGTITAADFARAWLIYDVKRKP
ncbi:MAG: CBS domain-containing protein [Caldilineaceae bacterium]